MEKTLAIILSAALLICACSFLAYAVVESDSSSNGWHVWLNDEMMWDHVYVYAYDGRGYPIDAQ